MVETREGGPVGTRLRHPLLIYGPPQVHSYLHRTATASMVSLGAVYKRIKLTLLISHQEVPELSKSPVKQSAAHAITSDQRNPRVY